MEELNSKDPLVSTLEPNDPAIITAIDEWMKQSERAYKKKRERMRKNEQLYNNDMALSTGTDQTQIKVNMSLATIESIMPIVDDYLPTFDIMPEDQDDQQWADMVQKRKGQLERESNLKKKLMDCIHDEHVYGSGLVQCNLMLDDDGHLKKFGFSVPDVFGWYPSPDATGMDIRSEASYHVFATPMHVGKIKRLYGVDITPEGNLDEHRSFRVSDIDNKGNNPEAGQEALLKEAYWCDPDTTKYPYGRYVLCSGQTIIKDEPLWDGADVEDDSVLTIPYFLVGNYKSPHSLYGIGEPELNRTLVKALNETLSAMSEHVKKAGFPIKKITQSLYAKLKKRIAGKAGEEVIVDKPTDFTFENPPSLQAGVTQFIEIIIKMMEFVSGQYEVARGGTPSGVTAAQAISALQEAAQSRIRYKIAHEITDLVTQIGRYMTFCIQTYDRKARALRSEIEGQAQFMPYKPDMAMDENGVYQNETGFDPTTGKTLSDSRFEVEVIAGFRTPNGRVSAEERAITLFEKGIYTIETVLDRLNEPDKSEILKQYYKAQGIEETVQREEQMQQAYPQFQQIAQMAATQDISGSGEESTLKAMIQQFPELMQSEEWQMIPTQTRQRVSAWLYTDETQQQNAIPV